MKRLFHPLHLTFVIFLSVCLSGCATPKQNIAAGIAIGALAIKPTNELEQVYYLGVFDPQDQLPPTIYRVRVRGQASAFSNMKFSSGWVPAALIDTLGTSLRFTPEVKHNAVTITEDSTHKALIKKSRRLMLFGPEGFREAPADHRLVIMMGANPDKFFKAIDSAVDTVAQATQTKSSDGFERLLFKTLVEANAENDQLQYAIDNAKASLNLDGGEK